jgi:hypothetical protein
MLLQAITVRASRTPGSGFVVLCLNSCGASVGSIVSSTSLSTCCSAMPSDTPGLPALSGLDARLSSSASVNS